MASSAQTSAARLAAALAASQAASARVQTSTTTAEAALARLALSAHSSHPAHAFIITAVPPHLQSAAQTARARAAAALTAPHAASARLSVTAVLAQTSRARIQPLLVTTEAAQGRVAASRQSGRVAHAFILTATSAVQGAGGRLTMSPMATLTARARLAAAATTVQVVKAQVAATVTTAEPGVGRVTTGRQTASRAHAFVLTGTSSVQAARASVALASIVIFGPVAQATAVALGGTVNYPISNTASGSRVRGGTAAAVQRVVSSASGSRTRGGRAYPRVGVLPTGGSGGVDGVLPYAHWRFDDPVTGDFYIFKTNPNAGGSPNAKKNLTHVPTTAADGTPITYEGDDDLSTSEFSGTFQQKADYDAFKIWFAKRRPVQLTDDLGRRSIIVITKIVSKRKWSRQHNYRQDITVSYLILDRGTS